MEDLIIIGAGGLGKEVAWIVERINKINRTWNLIGFIDDNINLQGKIVNGYKVFGTTKDILNYKDSHFICAIASADIRKRIIQNYSYVKYATIIDPSVELSNYIEIGQGSIISLNSTITVNIKIGNHVIINYDCTIGHDSIIYDYCTLYPSVNVSGKTKVKECCEIGTGTQIIQGLTIGENTIIGAGTVVIKDLPSNCTVVGVPAKIIKYRN